MLKLQKLLRKNICKISTYIITSYVITLLLFRWDPIGLNPSKQGKPGTIQKKPIFPKKFQYPKQQQRAQFDPRQPNSADISRIDVVVAAPQRPSPPRSAVPWQGPGRKRPAGPPPHGQPALHHVPAEYRQLIGRPNQLIPAPTSATPPDRAERQQQLFAVEETTTFR